MKRWHEEYSRTVREWKKYYIRCVESNVYDNRILGRDPYQVDSVWNQKGRYRKTKAFDCGNPQCKVCHSDKFPVREKTRQETLSDLRFSEQLLEVDSNEN